MIQELESPLAIERERVKVREREHGKAIDRCQLRRHPIGSEICRFFSHQVHVLHRNSLLGTAWDEEILGLPLG